MTAERMKYLVKINQTDEESAVRIFEIDHEEERRLLDTFIAGFSAVIRSHEFRLWIVTATLTFVVLSLYNWIIVEPRRLDEAQARYGAEISSRLLQWYHGTDRMRCGEAREYLNRAPRAEDGEQGMGFRPTVTLEQFSGDTFFGVIEQANLRSITLDQRLLVIKSELFVESISCAALRELIREYIEDLD